MTFEEYIPLLREFCLSEGLPKPEEFETSVTPYQGAAKLLIFRWRPMTGFNVDIVPFLTFQSEDPEEFVMAIKTHFAQFSGQPTPEFPNWKAFLDRKFGTAVGVPIAPVMEPKGLPIDAQLKSYFPVIQAKTYWPASAFPTLTSGASEGVIHTTPQGKKWVVIQPNPFTLWLCEAKG